MKHAVQTYLVKFYAKYERDNEMKGGMTLCSFVVGVSFKVRSLFSLPLNLFLEKVPPFVSAGKQSRKAWWTCSPRKKVFVENCAENFRKLGILIFHNYNYFRFFFENSERAPTARRQLSAAQPRQLLEDLSCSKSCVFYFAAFGWFSFKIGSFWVQSQRKTIISWFWIAGRRNVRCVEVQRVSGLFFHCKSSCYNVMIVFHS